MKKGVLSLLATGVFMFMISGTAIAQKTEVNIDLPVYQHAGETIKPEHKHIYNKKAAYTGWKDPVDAAASAGGTFSSFVDFIFQDTSVVFISDDGTSRNNQTAAVGLTFDPTDVNFEITGDGIKLARWDAYTVDSIFFPYLYVRWVDSFDFGSGMEKVVDTLVVQFYTANELGFFTLQNADADILAIPNDYNPSKGGHSSPAWEMRIPLTDADSTQVPSATGWRSSGRQLAVGNNIPNNPNLQGDNVCAMSISFRTALPYSAGDTMETRDNSVPTKRLNYFGYSLWLNQGSKVLQSEAYNNSFITIGSLVYGNATANGWENAISGNAFQTNRYVRGLFNISTTTLGEEQLGDNMSVTVFPNPVSNTETLNVEFDLVNSEDVEIVMYDLLGKVVKTIATGKYAAGSHQESVSLDGLQAGVYIYSVKAGDVTSSQKITVTQ